MSSFANDIVNTSFEDCITFVYVFTKVVEVFARYEFWVNMPVAIFLQWKISNLHFANQKTESPGI